VYIPGVELTAADWIFLAGVFLAALLGMATRRETAALLTVVALALGLSTSGYAAAGYVAVLFILVGKGVQFWHAR